MKRYIILIIGLLSSNLLTAQVGVEADTPLGDELLFFPDTNVDGGIVLSRVDLVSQAYTGSTTGGELLYDMAKNEVVYYSTQTNRWEPLTNPSSNSPSNYTYAEAQGGGVVITDDINKNIDTDGVLILSSDNKALALPRVENVLTLPSPKPGTICYDKNSDSLAIFNGEEWSFWN